MSGYTEGIIILLCINAIAGMGVSRVAVSSSPVGSTTSTASTQGRVGP